MGFVLICTLFIIAIVEAQSNIYLRQRVTALTSRLWDYAELRARAEFFAASKFIESEGVEEAKIALEGLVDADYLDAIAKTIADTKTAKKVEMAEYGSSRISSGQSER